jgi:hypothetical protein
MKMIYIPLDSTAMKYLKILQKKPSEKLGISSVMDGLPPQR